MSETNLNSENKSLDDVLKDIVNEDSSVEETKKTEKRRGRPAKAVEELATAEKHEETKSVANDQKIEDTKSENKEEPSSDSKEEPAAEKESKEDDSKEIEGTSLEQETKKEDSVNEDVIEADSNVSESMVGKSFRLHKPTTVYRGPSKSARLNKFCGIATITDDSNKDFVQIKYVKSGLGMCKGYILRSDMTI